jgi:endonuclease/exonuclease/phosphatase family metal-dependent hydrolase
MVFNGIQPDLIVLTDVAGTTGYAGLLDIVSRPPYRSAPFTEGLGNENALIYNESKLELVDYDTIKTYPRISDVWTVVVRGTTDTIRIYGTHLMADSSRENLELRQNAARAIRQHMVTAASQHYLLAGNLNVFSSQELTYQLLTELYEASPDGIVLDPLNRPGVWHHNPEFADIHTESTRTREFGRGRIGGLRDRFDFVLISPSLQSEYMPLSYTTFGNDGRHYRDSINAVPNHAVDSVMAQALHDASDHLPVYLDLVFTKRASGVEEEKEWQQEMDLSQNKGW